MLPCLIFEDEHLLVVNKPAGWNTHAPSPYSGEGIYDWLRHREPRWASLAIIHRLDKETSGVIVFAKTPLANRSMTQQFTTRTVTKKYVLVTDRRIEKTQWVVRSSLVRSGERYLSRPAPAGGQIGETQFRVLAAAEATRLLPNHPAGRARPLSILEAEPLTGRTHQIRVHAADEGFPILGDALYGGTNAERVYLHAAEITLEHPASGQETTFRAPVNFAESARRLLRTSLIEPEATNAYRLVHGASDGRPGWYLDKLGDYLLSSGEEPLSPAQGQELQWFCETSGARGSYHKLLSRQVRQTNPGQASPQRLAGQTAPERFSVRENGLQFELSFDEGYSVGLFLDQRDNRRRMLVGHIATGFELAAATVLNTFAYTCGFSVCAAKAGARTTSLDLSRKYLEWGKRNFVLNQLEPAPHDFIYGDVFDWLRRLAKKARSFDVVLLDPPTFSQSKQSGVFRAERDYGRLVAAALPLLNPGGVLFASTNSTEWPAEEFLSMVHGAIRAANRKVLQSHFVPQAPDFPVSRAEPAYLKTVWLRIQ